MQNQWDKMRRFNPNWLNRVRKRDDPEARLLLRIIKYCLVNNCYVGKVKVKGSFSKQGNFIIDRYLMRGLPDAFAFKDSVMYAIETKVAPNKLSDEQKVFQSFFHKPPDRIYIVAYALEDVEKYIWLK